MKSVEQKLYEAFRNMKGVRLTAQDVEDLLLLDDAIRTRISNVACAEAGVPEIGEDCMNASTEETWQQFVAGMK